MYERMKKLLYYCINLVVALVFIGASFLYVGVSSFMMSRVINDLRLDTYVGMDTGIGIVMLILLLVWAPVILLRPPNVPPRFTGKL
jgi:hypothetical protein